jgi:two-component system, OmpR family, osmolarity sensor histidine kinase EnvZ
LALMQRFPGKENHARILDQAYRQFGLAISIDDGATLPDTASVNVLGSMDDDLTAALGEEFKRKFYTDWISDPRSVLVQVQLPYGVMKIAVPRERLYAWTIYAYVFWIAGTAAIVFAIAALFMRDQVRDFRRLSAAAEAFGMGRDIGLVRPEGAVEARKAAAAFNRMHERIRHFLVQRTEMLAGVSHDLRTPLTRLKLALAMLPPCEDTHKDLAENAGRRRGNGADDQLGSGQGAER